MPEQVFPASAPRKDTAPPQARLRDYIASLRHPDEISELILHLEATCRGELSDDPGLGALVAEGGLDLADEQMVRAAILMLGRRAETLQAQSAITPLEGHDLSGLSSQMVRLMETVRLGEPDGARLPEKLGRATREALDLMHRNQPARTPEDARWWSAVDHAVMERMLPGYVRQALILDAIEDDPVRGTLLRNPFAMALICALPGLLTAPTSLSTPLVCLALGLIGYFAVHPFWVSQIIAPLRAIRQNLADEGDRIARLASDEPWPDAAFRIPSVIDDLLPILEAERRAGRASEVELRATIGRYFDEVGTRYPSESRAPRTFEQLRGLMEGRLARDYAVYARARTRWEGTFLAHVLDSRWLSGALLATLTLPISTVVTLITPFPPGVDFPLMVGLFALLGSKLPNFLPGTSPSRDAMVGRLTALQGDLEQLP